MSDNNPPNGSIQSQPSVAQDDIVTRLRAMDMWCWHNAHHNISECPDCAERHEAADEIERLRAMCEQFAQSAKSFGTKWGSDVVDFRINEKKFRKAWEKYKGGAW